MRAARNIILSTAALSASLAYAADDPRYLAGGGRQGFYWEAFLLNDEPAGVGAIRDVKLAFITNEGQATDVAFLANCNPGYPHVVDEEDRKTDIRVNARPSQAELLPYAVWHASCRKQFGRFSERGADGRRQLSSAKFSFSMGGVEQAAEIKPNLKLGPMRGLTQVATGIPARSETVFVYCSPSVPTVFWPVSKSKIEISDADEERTRKGGQLVERALSIWGAVCKPLPTQQPDRIAKGESNVTPKSANSDRTSASIIRSPETNGQASKGMSNIAGADSVGAASSKAEIAAIKTLYQMYIFRSRICEIVKEYSDDSGSVKNVMSQVDQSAKARGVDTDKLWKEAVATLYEADFGPQLKMIESLEGMGGFSLPSDRRKAAPQCAQLSSLRVRPGTHDARAMRRIRTMAAAA